MKRLRVTHVVPAFFGSEGVFGGAERYVYELARHMARATPTSLVAFGDEMKRFTTEEGLAVTILGPCRRVRNQEFNRFHLGLFKAIGNSDVVHCHQHHTFAAEVAALHARIRRARVFASDLGGGGWGASVYINTDSWFHGHLHISNYSRRISNHEHRAGTHVIYGGVDTTVFNPDPFILRKPIVVFVGRLMPHKGVNDLIDALPPGLSLEVIGRPYNAAYSDELYRLAAGKQICFRPRCADSDIVSSYRSATCVVLPSVYKNKFGGETKIPELLGQTLLEGMACGAPAICTDVASMPEIVEDGLSGFVVPPNDPSAMRAKLEYLRDHPSEVSRMGEAARERVTTFFNWNTVVERCLASYCE